MERQDSLHERRNLGAMLPIDPYVLGAGVLMLLSVLSSRLSSRFGVPSLLIFLLIGMLTGSDGPGGIPFDDAEQAQGLGTIALVLIMFTGGMSTHWRHVRPVLMPALSLATVGVLVTTLLVAACSHMVWTDSWSESLLLGAMVSSTDAAALFGVMRSQGLELKGHLNALLEVESGTNDPMAVFLTTTFIALRLHEGHFTLAHALWELVREMGLGLLLGMVSGGTALAMVRYVTLETDGLYVVLTTGVALLTYGFTEVIGGSGFLAVYAAGVVLGSSRFPRKQLLSDMHEGLGWLSQILMFLSLGLLVFPSQLPQIAPAALVVSFFLVLVARPLSVFVALAWSGFSWREKLLVSWCGLRGAVPIILATFPLVADVRGAWASFHTVFFIVLVSVLLQGTSVPWLAGRLGLRAPSGYQDDDAAEARETEEGASDGQDASPREHSQ